MGVQRLAVGAVAPTITAAFRDGLGQLTDAGTVTVAVADWAGAAVTTGAVTNNADGTYTATITDPVTEPTQWTATWTAAAGIVTTTVDVVGQRLVWPEEFARQPGLSLSSRTPEEVSAAIAWFEDLAYDYCGWSPIVRFRQAALRGEWGRFFQIPDPYVIDLLGITWQAVGVADVVATEDDLALFEVTVGGALYGSYVTSRALVAYTHGNPAETATLHDAAIAAVRLHLQENSAGRPMLSVRDELGVTRFSTAGKDRPTGLPDVDAVLNGLRFPVCA